MRMHDRVLREIAGAFSGVLYRERRQKGADMTPIYTALEVMNALLRELYKGEPFILQARYLTTYRGNTPSVSVKMMVCWRDGHRLREEPVGANIVILQLVYTKAIVMSYRNAYEWIKDGYRKAREIMMTRA